MTAPSFAQGLSGVVRIVAQARIPGRPTVAVANSGFSPIFTICAGKQGFAGEIDLYTTPIAGRVVRLYERSSGKLVREVISDSAGLYAFPGVSNLRNYYIVGLDLQPGGVSAAIADYVTPT